MSAPASEEDREDLRRRALKALRVYAVLVAALVKRMRGLDQRWWLPGAVRQTAGPVVATALALMVLGFVLQLFAREARSIGEAVHHWQESSPR